MRLHERLRRERQRRGLTTAALARTCGVREHNLVLIELDKFEELPTGLYGRNAVRCYAAALGVPADEALAEVIERLRTPEDALEGFARIRGMKSSARPRPVEADAVVVAPRLGQAGQGIAWRPFAASAIDGALLVGIDLLLLVLTARVARVPTAEILRIGMPPMLVLCAVIAGLYFLLLGGIGRATIGTRLVHLPASAAMLDGVDVRTVIQRGLHYAMFEGSSLVSWAAASEQARQWIRTLRERRA
jgi:transcriptional regulator with XRE-family HTH domain